MDRLNAFFLSSHVVGCALVLLSDLVDHGQGESGRHRTPVLAVRLLGAGVILILLASVLSLFSSFCAAAVDASAYTSALVALFFFFLVTFARRYTRPSQSTPLWWDATGTVIDR